MSLPSDLTTGLLQRRAEFNIGTFHVWAGEQIIPHQEMVVGHVHEQPHLMVLTRGAVESCPHCSGKIPQPSFRVWAKQPNGKEEARMMKPYDLVYIGAGVQHSVEQTVDGAVGGFACVFSVFDENGNRLEDPKREDDPRAMYWRKP